MKKWIWLSVLLVLVVSLCSFAAVADNDDSQFGDIFTYSDFATVLNNSSARVITIHPSKTNGLETTYLDDTWPSEEAVVELDAVNPTADIWFGNGSITIPSNVTFLASDPITMTGNDSLTINGTWKMVTNQGSVRSVSSNNTPCGTVVIGKTGKLITADGLGSADPINVENFVVNGTVQCGEGNNTCLGNVTLGSTAKVTGSTLWLDGSVAGPSSGYAEITAETYLAPDTNAVDLYGNLHFAKVTISTGGTLRIKSGSHVIIDDLYIMPDVRGALEVEEGGRLTVNECSIASDVPVTISGIMEFTAEDTQTHRTNFTLDGGWLVVRPGVWFGGRDCVGSIKGNGQLRLYGQIYPDGSVENCPTIYGSNTQWDMETLKQSGKIGSDVTIWTNWENNACLHANLISGAVVAPTCGKPGYTEQFCTECLTMVMGNLVDPTWKHELEREGNAEYCINGCGYNVRATYYPNSFVRVSYDTYVAEGERVLAAIYDSSNQFLAMGEYNTLNGRIVIYLQDIPAGKTPALVKVFSTEGNWAAKRGTVDFVLTAE